MEYNFITAGVSVLTDRNTSVLRYCPISDTWSVMHTCSVHVRKQQMLSVEDTIYLVGGYTHELETWRRRPNQTEDVLTVSDSGVVDILFHLFYRC